MFLRPVVPEDFYCLDAFEHLQLRQRTPNLFPSKFLLCSLQVFASFEDAGSSSTSCTTVRGRQRRQLGIPFALSAQRTPGLAAPRRVAFKKGRKIATEAGGCRWMLLLLLLWWWWWSSSSPPSSSSSSIDRLSLLVFLSGLDLSQVSSSGS